MLQAACCPKETSLHPSSDWRFSMVGRVPTHKSCRLGKPSCLPWPPYWCWRYKWCIWTRKCLQMTPLLFNSGSHMLWVQRMESLQFPKLHVLSQNPLDNIVRFTAESWGAWCPEEQQYQNAYHCILWVPRQLLGCPQGKGTFFPFSPRKPCPPPQWVYLSFFWLSGEWRLEQPHARLPSLKQRPPPVPGAQSSLCQVLPSPTLWKPTPLAVSLTWFLWWDVNFHVALRLKTECCDPALFTLWVLQTYFMACLWHLELAVRSYHWCWSPQDLSIFLKTAC